MRPTLLAPVVVAVLAVGGCGDTDAGSTGSTNAPAASNTPTPAAISFEEACPEIEAGLPGGNVPSASRWQKYEAALRDLKQAGDTETQNALDILLPAVTALADDPEAGLPLLDARDDLRSALDTLADRCSAVGSSALQ